MIQKKQLNKFFEIAVVILCFLLFWLGYYQVIGKVWPNNNIGFYRIALHLTQCAALCISAFVVFGNYIKNKNKIQLLVFLILSILFFTRIFNWVSSILTNPIFYQLSSIAKQKSNNSQLGNYYLQNFISALTYSLLGLGYAFGRDWFIKERESIVLEKEIAEAELSLLRNQLNPHFLFNTINNIYYLALIQSTKTAEALLQLSDLLRYVLAEKEKWVTLDKEYECLEKFILLHRLRFPKDIVNLNISQNDLFANVQVPPMILITFVENAFKHGESNGPDAPMEIHLSIIDMQLRYEVLNKIGDTPSKDNNSGIGIPNLKKRLNILYPEKHTLSFDISKTHYIAKLEINLNN